LAIEAQRLQAAFNAAKPGVVSGLKGVDGAPAGTNGGLGLKGPDDGQRGGSQAAWAATITDPRAAVYAHHLASIVPPMPISEKEVSLDCKMIYMNGNKVLNDTDYVITGLQMVGVLGEFNVAGKILMIGSKTFIAGENGAYMYLVRRDKDFDAAAAYLKDPATAQAFAHLVDNVRQNRPLPPRADPAMVQAAQAINAHHAGDDIGGKQAIVPIAWDFMTSPEAVSAMLRQAWIEAASELVSAGVGTQNHGIFTSQAERKAMFDSLRMERKEVRTLMDMTRPGDELRTQLTSVVRHIDQTSADIWKMDKFGKRLISGAASVPIADATDKMATILMGKEAKGDEY
jgi:5S rRNA maturation endonuclease (ribonuclease M5)